MPKDVTVPYLTVTQDTLDQAVSTTPVGGVANKEYTQEEAAQAIQTNTKR
ncbi:hypothetical protein ACFQU7_39630 [Pseudoroseomonas wenyumeiae]